MADPKREIRKHLMIMIALTLAIHAVAIVAYHLMGIEDAPRDRRMLFTGAWTLLTLVAVLHGLYRIRVARNMRPRARR
jgi:hypothetical protein